MPYALIRTSSAAAVLVATDDAAAAAAAIKMATALGEFEVGDAGGYAVRNLKLTPGAYLGGDKYGLKVEFEACGMISPGNLGESGNGNWRGHSLRLLRD